MSTDYRTALQTALEVEHRKFFSQEKRLRLEHAVHTACPSCEDAESKLIFVKDGFIHRRCQTCTLIYINPRLNDEATAAFYNSRANEIYNEQKFYVESSATSSDDKYNLDLLEWVLERAPAGERPKRFLEIGPARGTVMKAIEEHGWLAYGVELNAVNAAALSVRFPDRVFDRDLSELDLPDGHFELIYLRDVIEHLPDPISFLRNCNRLLKPEGLICIATHNIDGRIHDIVGRRHSVVFGFEHPVHWSPDSLGHALSKSGYERPIIRFGCNDPSLRYVISDLSLSGILAYYLDPPFTCIFPSWPSLRPAMRWLLRLMNNRYIGLRNPWFFRIDSWLWLKFARRRGKESYFAALARKRS